MRYREVGDIFFRKNRYIMVTEGVECKQCIFMDYDKGDCPSKNKCVPIYREDSKSVFYRDVTDMLAEGDKTLIDLGFFTQLSTESRRGIDSFSDDIMGS